MSGLNITLAQEYYEDLSGVNGDGLGEGEVAFEGEEECWEDWPLQFFLRFDLGRAEGLKSLQTGTKSRTINRPARL